MPHIIGKTIKKKNKMPFPILLAMLEAFDPSWTMTTYSYTIRATNMAMVMMISFI